MREGAKKKREKKKGRKGACLLPKRKKGKEGKRADFISPSPFRFRRKKRREKSTAKDSLVTRSYHGLTWIEEERRRTKDDDLFAWEREREKKKAFPMTRFARFPGKTLRHRGEGRAFGECRNLSGRTEKEKKKKRKEEMGMPSMILVSFRQVLGEKKRPDVNHIHNHTT